MHSGWFLVQQAPEMGACFFWGGRIAEENICGKDEGKGVAAF